MAPRLPDKLLGGRVRTSTVLLSLLFAGVLVLYLAVRPPPTVERAGNGSQPARQTTREQNTTAPTQTGRTETTPTDTGRTGTTPTDTTPTDTTPAETGGTNTTPAPGTDTGGANTAPAQTSPQPRTDTSTGP